MREFEHHQDAARFCIGKLSSKFWADRLGDMLEHASRYKTRDGSTGNSHLRVMRVGDFPRAAVVVEREADGARLRLKFDGKAFKVERVK